MSSQGLGVISKLVEWQKMIGLIDNGFRNLEIRKSVRFTYEHDPEAIIIKCMPSETHERTGRTFLINLTNKVASIPGHSVYSILPFGSTRF